LTDLYLDVISHLIYFLISQPYSGADTLKYSVLGANMRASASLLVMYLSLSIILGNREETVHRPVFTDDYGTFWARERRIFTMAIYCVFL